MNAPLTYRSAASSPFAADLAESAYGVLRRAEPSEAERVLLDRVARLETSLSTLDALAAHSCIAHPNVLTAIEACRPGVVTQRYEATYSVALVALTTRGYRVEAIAPVDYPALAKALAHAA